MPKPHDVVLTVDRAGRRGYVIVQDDAEREASLPVTWFSHPPAEGDVFRLSLRPDDRLRNERRRAAADLAHALDEGAGPDDVEIL